MSAPSDNATAESNRRSRWAELSAVVALGISALALAVGAYQTRLMQTQARASVWPYVVSGFNYADFGEHEGFELHLQNNGVGPAILRSSVVKFDGKPIKNWDALIDALMAGHHGEEVHATLAGIHGIVIPPSTNRETDVAAIHTKDAVLAKELYAAHDRLSVDICYCSIYDDCWISRWMQRRAEPTSACHETADEFDY